MPFTLEYLEQVPYELLDDPVESQATAEEITARVSKYVVMESVMLPFTEDNMFRIARDNIPNNKGFLSAVRKVWTQMYKNKGGLDLAALEIEAEILGVYEDIWPVPDEEILEEVA